MRRVMTVLGLSAALFLGGGTGLVLSNFGSGPAGADTSNLGGFTVNALAEAVTAQYEQPNFPLPSNPSLEFDEGYAVASDNYGPSGSATASTLYPGQVVANAGPELSLLVPGVPVPPAPVWPLQAVTDYPQTPNTATLDEPGANMDATSGTNGSSATSTLGDDAATAGGNGAQPTQAPSGSGNPLAATSSLMGIGGLSATSSSTTTATDAIATATSTVTGLSLLAGFINVGAITSTATSDSNGTSAKLTGSTVVSNIDIAGEQVTITANGIEAVGKSAPLALPIAALNTLLKELGVTLQVTSAVDKNEGAMASRTLDGVQLSINLDTLDNAANKFASLLPAKLTSALPIALPNAQVLTVDLGTVTVNAAASPTFTSSGNTGNTGNTGANAGSAGSFTPSTGSNTGNTGFGGTTSGSTFGSTTPSTTGGTPSGTTTPTGSGLATPLAATPSVFKGVGSGLILLGVLAALAMAYAYKRADDASELVGAACTEGDPLGSRFLDDDESGGLA